MERAMTGRRIGWIAGVLLAVLLGWAWIDGGEQPLRPIAQPVAVPGSAA